MPCGFFSCLRWCVSFKVLWWRSLHCTVLPNVDLWIGCSTPQHLCWRTSFHIVGVRMWNSLIGRKCRYCETQIENLDIRSHSVKSLEHYNRMMWLFSFWRLSLHQLSARNKSSISFSLLEFELRGFEASAIFQKGRNRSCPKQSLLCK